jgi:hypothetical protein
MSFGQKPPDDPEAERRIVRLRKMTDAELIRQGKAAREMSKSGFGNEPGNIFLVQLEECRAEWRRRHPKAES